MSTPEDNLTNTTMSAAIKNIPSIYFGPYLVTPQVSNAIPHSP